MSNDSPRHTETELVLDRAQRDLSELCCDENSSFECWKALSYFVTKRQQHERQCDLEHEEGQRDANACSSLNALEKFTREQMAAGSAGNLCNQLLIMQRSEARRAAATSAGAPDGQAASLAATAASASLSAEQLHERACLIRLFHHLDADADGQLDMLEFQDGMEALGAVLTEDDIRQISEAVAISDQAERSDGVSTRLELDSFLDILDASPVLRGVALGGGDPNFLRHATHIHGHRNSHLEPAA